METLAEIFSWKVATEPPLKDQVDAALKGTSSANPGFILSIDASKVVRDEDFHAKSVEADYIAIAEKSTRFKIYCYFRKEIYKKGKVYSVIGYNGLDFLYFISSHENMIPAFKVEYTSYYEISTPLKIIENLQLIYRKELSKKNHHYRQMKQRLEEHGLLVAPIGKRRD